MPNKILQITPHLGGGLGRVIINWIREDNKRGKNIHKLFSLEKTQNATEEYKDLNDYIFYDKNQLDTLITEADLVIVNWYNHPLLNELLYNYKFPSCRLICYNHVSSLNSPYNMYDALFNYFDHIVFTTKASYYSEEFMEYLELTDNSLKFSTIESAFGSEKYDNILNIEKRYNVLDFNIGYHGTASYSKLDKNFINLCKDTTEYLNPDTSKFIICSGDSQEHLIQEAHEKGVSHWFDFKGRVENVSEYLKKVHVFGYPLQPKHLGSAEQVLGEAMMFGAVPIVMNNPAEECIIKSGYNGIVAKTYDEYSAAIGFLYRNPNIRDTMALNAFNYARYEYSLNKKIFLWNRIFYEALKLNKEEHQLNKRFNKSKITGADLFIYSLGTYGKIFENYINYTELENFESITKTEEQIKELFNSNDQWKYDNKAGVKQYLKYYPGDKYLQAWEKLL